MKRTKAVIAGHVCIDFTPSLGGAPCKRVEEFLAPGKLLQAGPARFSPGGVVANTGLAMKFFGADVSLMGKVGDDDFGRMVMDIFRRAGAQDGMITDPGESTSYTVVIAVPGIDRIFLHNPGANDSLSEKDIDYGKCDDAAVFHFGYPPIVARMYRDGGRELTDMMRKVRERGCITSLDMAMMDEESEAAAADWPGILERTLPFVDFFMPSIEEILFTMDRDRYRDLQRRAAGADATAVISIEDDVRPVAKRLLAMGCRLVILKCGASGFYYRTASDDRFDELRRQTGLALEGFGGREGFEASFVPEKVVSGTGAGDTTIAGFLTAMLRDYPFDRCIQLASATGACCVAGAGSQDGLKPFEEMEKKIDAGWEKNVTAFSCF